MSGFNFNVGYRQPNLNLNLTSSPEKLLKSKEISEDDEKKFEKKIQTITNDQIKKIDEKVISKETEIMKI